MNHANDNKSTGIRHSPEKKAEILKEWEAAKAQGISVRKFVFQIRKQDPSDFTFRKWLRELSGEASPPRTYKKKVPSLVTVPVETPKKKNILVLMGDADEVKEVLSTAFDVLKR